MELLNIQSFDKKETNGSEESHISLDDEELNNSAGFYRAIDNEIIPEAPLSFNFDDTLNSSSTQHDQVLEQNNLDFNQHEISDFDLLQKIEDDIRYGDIEHYDDDPDNNPTPPKDQKKKNRCGYVYPLHVEKNR